MLIAELRIVDLPQNLVRGSFHEVSHAWEVDRSHIVPIVSGIGKIVFKDAAELECVRSPQVAGIIREFNDVIGESPWCLDENAIGGRNQCARLAPGDVPNAGQISSLQYRQLRYGNILEIHRAEIAVGPVEARACFIDPLRRDDPCQRQLEKLVPPVLGGPVNAELSGPNDIRLVENITPIQRVFVAELGIDAAQDVIFGRGLNGIIDELSCAVAVIGPVRQRVKIHHRLDARIHSNELLDSVDWQISLVCARVWNRRVIRKPEPLAQSFIGGEEEQFIFFDRSTDNTAELIPLESRNFLARRIEIVLGIERAVAQEFKSGAMECVGSRIGDHVHHTARDQPIFGAVVVGRDGEFANRIDSEIRHRHTARGLP